MMGSTGRRHKLGWMTGAGMICLGAGEILISGCSTTTVSSIDPPNKASQQVAGSSKPAANKKSAAQVASKNAPGKARISDLDDESRVQMAAQVARNRAPSGATAPPRGAVVAQAPAAPTVTPAAPRGQQTAPASGAAIAAQDRRPAPPTAPRTRTANTLASNARSSSGSIRQTAGDSQSPPAIAKRANVTTPPTRPIITPKKTEWQPENGGDPIASNHERKRADRLMERAYTMFENGFREEALRLAAVAAELESSQQAVYKPGEDRPSDFIAALVKGAPAAGTPQSVLAERKSAAVKAGSPSIARRNTATRKRSAEPRSAETRLADASVQPQTAADAESSATNSPRFSDGKDNLIAAANSGQTDVPLPHSPRNADAAVVAAEGSRRSLDAATAAGDARTVVTADRIEVSPSAQAPQMLASTANPTAVAAANPAEIEPISESDAPVAAPAPTSQLTIASLIGLLTGVGGMLGLGWWRRQERQHYAPPPKDTGLRIRDSDQPIAAKRRAA